MADEIPATTEQSSRVALARDVLRAQNILADVSHVLPTIPDDQEAVALLSKALNATVDLRLHLEGRRS